MRLIGYCTRCHRVRQVRVTGLQIHPGVPLGICDECEDEREATP